MQTINFTHPRHMPPIPPLIGYDLDADSIFEYLRNLDLLVDAVSLETDRYRLNHAWYSFTFTEA